MCPYGSVHQMNNLEHNLLDGGVEGEKEAYSRSQDGEENDAVGDCGEAGDAADLSSWVLSTFQAANSTFQVVN